MRSLCITVALALAAGLAPAAALAQAGDAPAGSGSLLGSWRLLTQRYEAGEHNFAPGDAEPVVLSFAQDAGAVVARVSGFGQSGAWPLYPSPTGPAALDDVQVRIAPDLRSATASYRVLPPVGDDTALRVVESYRIDDDGRLAGTMTIRFERQGEERGGYTWTRVFAREGGR